MARSFLITFRVSTVLKSMKATRSVPRVVFLSRLEVYTNNKNPLKRRVMYFVYFRNEIHSMIR